MPAKLSKLLLKRTIKKKCLRQIHFTCITITNNVNGTQCQQKHQQWKITIIMQTAMSSKPLCKSRTGRSKEEIINMRAKKHFIRRMMLHPKCTPRADSNKSKTVYGNTAGLSHHIQVDDALQQDVFLQENLWAVSKHEETICTKTQIHTPRRAAPLQ